MTITEDLLNNFKSQISKTALYFVLARNLQNIDLLLVNSTYSFFRTEKGSTSNFGR